MSCVATADIWTVDVNGGGDYDNIQDAIKIARQLGAKTVDLTSRPSREAANRLYNRLGFVQRDTNIYRFEI